MGYVFKLYIAIDVIISIVLFIVYFLIDDIYIGLSISERDTLKKIFLIFATYSVLAFPFTPLSGVLNAYEKFVWLKFCELFQKLFAIFLILVLGIIFLSSHFVWNIEIIEENGLAIENIMEDIQEAGLKIGTLKNDIDTKEIINKVRLERDDIAWIGIELKGTNAIVRLVKAEEKPEIIDEEEYCNIVSNKNGVITKINAQDGTANVKVGDTVSVGDVLINGWMEGKYTGIRYVHAKGEIEARVWYTMNKTIPYTTTEKQATGNIETSYGIKINNFKINFPKGVSKFKFYDTIENENKIKLFSNFYLPVSVVKTTYQEYEEIEKKYSIEEAKKIGIQEIEAELESQIENKENIVNKNINTYENENSIDIYVTYEVLETIGTNEKIVF